MRIIESLGHPYPGEVDYYRQSDGRSCVPSALAYLMFRIDAPEPFWHPETMDTVLGRAPGQLTEHFQAGVLSLLEQGAKVQSVTAYDSQRFIDEGLDYLADYCTSNRDSSGSYVTDDPEMFFDYWTSDRIEKHKAYESEFLEKAATYGDQYQLVQKHPQLTDLTSAVSMGGMVLHTAPSTLGHGTAHARVALANYTQRPDRSIILFENEINPPIIEVDLQWFGEEGYYPGDGVTIFTKYSS